MLVKVGESAGNIAQKPIAKKKSETKDVDEVTTKNEVAPEKEVQNEELPEWKIKQVNDYAKKIAYREIKSKIDRSKNNEFEIQTQGNRSPAEKALARKVATEIYNAEMEKIKQIQEEITSLISEKLGSTFDGEFHYIKDQTGSKGLNIEGSRRTRRDKVVGHMYLGNVNSFVVENKGKPFQITKQSNGTLTISEGTLSKAKVLEALKDIPSAEVEKFMALTFQNPGEGNLRFNANSILRTSITEAFKGPNQAKLLEILNMTPDFAATNVAKPEQPIPAPKPNAISMGDMIEALSKNPDYDAIGSYEIKDTKLFDSSGKTIEIPEGRAAEGIIAEQLSKDPKQTFTFSIKGNEFKVGKSGSAIVATTLKTKPVPAEVVDKKPEPTTPAPTEALSDKEDKLSADDLSKLRFTTDAKDQNDGLKQATLKSLKSKFTAAQWENIKTIDVKRSDGGEIMDSGMRAHGVTIFITNKDNSGDTFSATAPHVYADKGLLAAIEKIKIPNKG